MHATGQLIKGWLVDSSLGRHSAFRCIQSNLSLDVSDLVARRAVTGLIQHERLELSAGIGITAREYTERLIGEVGLL